MHKIQRQFFCLIVLFSLAMAYGQEAEQSAVAFQQALNDQYGNPDTSPLKGEASQFKGHDFFEIDTAFQVRAKFVRTLNALPFQMKTTTSRRPIYAKYGEALFAIDGRELRLSIFQNLELLGNKAYKDHLFLPFTDLTNGVESYGGGRFIDLRIPEGDSILIDFNKAYNPYCAYSKDYSCPIPPEENNLEVQIRAGVKKPKK